MNLMQRASTEAVRCGVEWVKEEEEVNNCCNKAKLQFYLPSCDSGLRERDNGCRGTSPDDGWLGRHDESLLRWLIGLLRLLPLCRRQSRRWRGGSEPGSWPSCIFCFCLLVRSFVHVLCVARPPKRSRYLAKKVDQILELEYTPFAPKLRGLY